MNPLKVIGILETSGYKEEARCIADLVADREAFAAGVMAMSNAAAAMESLVKEQNKTIKSLMIKLANTIDNGVVSG